METMRLLITLFTLAFAQLFFNMAHASPQPPVNADQHSVERNSARVDDRRKRRPLKAASAKKVKQQLNKKSKKITSTHRLTAVRKAKLITKTPSGRQPEQKLHAVKSQLSRHAASKQRYRLQQAGAESDTIGKEDLAVPLKLSDAHRIRYQAARKSVMSKLMRQLGKPYQWGGSSPKTGFDCSGLVWYAYKDLVKFKIPRTANAMYHLRDAAPIGRDKLEKGDLVFFRIHGRGAADHVGVYLGDDKFIQSPRTGKDIEVSALSGNYWQQHYVGARRVMTAKTVR